MTLVICHTCRRGNRPSWHCCYTVKVFSKAENEQWVFPSHPSPLPLCITQHVVKAKQRQDALWAGELIELIANYQECWRRQRPDIGKRRSHSVKNDSSYTDFPQVLSASSAVCAHGCRCVKPRPPRLFNLGYWEPLTWQPWHSVIMWSPSAYSLNLGHIQESCIC